MMRVLLKNTFLEIEEHAEQSTQVKATSPRARSHDAAFASPKAGQYVRCSSPAPSPRRNKASYEPQLQKLNQILGTAEIFAKVPVVPSTLSLSTMARDHAEGSSTSFSRENSFSSSENGRWRTWSCESVGESSSTDIGKQVSTLSDGGDQCAMDAASATSTNSSVVSERSSAKLSQMRDTTRESQGMRELSTAGAPKDEASMRKRTSSRLATEYLHSTVPRRVNLASQSGKQVARPTTIMLRNLPNRYSQRDLVAELEELGFGGSFDFLYSPLDKGTLSNVGYAFVNFVTPEWMEQAVQTLHGYRFKKYCNRASSKLAAVAIAHMQGLEANLAHYEKAAVNNAKLKQRRPIVVANISNSLAV
eukprot:TRINITY_DN23783_c0_g1_i1.p1 TRINITY_DN23783_c0_g1~~TRINITY_DN23783_c0_g1_i1.p1  ORF type:complete len:362 (+),score=74.06 TRINITY_DN23783_c0_g1_i1:59-1144(+)